MRIVVHRPSALVPLVWNLNKYYKPQILAEQVFEYKRLVQDNNRQVRESTHTAMAELTSNAGFVSLSSNIVRSTFMRVGSRMLFLP